METKSPGQIEALIQTLAPGGEGDAIHPGADALRALAGQPDDGPVQMINLLKFRARAAYPKGQKGHEPSGGDAGSGAEAYARYGAVAMRKVAERGGHLVLLLRPELGVVGSLGEWDQVAIVEYPSRAAFLDMLGDPEYQAATVHRVAGLERTVLLATRPLVDASRA